MQWRWLPNLRTHNLNCGNAFIFYKNATFLVHNAIAVLSSVRTIALKVFHMNVSFMGFWKAEQKN